MKAQQLPSNYRVSLKALIRDEKGRILLVKEAGFGWGIPGGGVDHGESLEEGLRREILEELGVDVAKASAEPVLIKTYFDSYNSIYKLWLVYAVELAGEPRAGEDADEIGWFALDEVTSLDLDVTEDEGVMDLVVVALKN